LISKGGKPFFILGWKVLSIYGPTGFDVKRALARGAQKCKTFHLDRREHEHDNFSA
jgi:hypothetical protein